MHACNCDGHTDDEHHCSPPTLCAPVCLFALQDLDGWQVTAGYVGLVRGSLPLTTTAGGPGGASAVAGANVHANLTLDEVLITLAPVTAATAAAAAAAAASPDMSANSAAGTAAYSDQRQQQQSFADDLGMLGQMGVLEGIKLIAGGLEAVLQRLSVAATNVTLRVEVPGTAGTGAPAAPSLGPPTSAVSGRGCVQGAELIVHLDCVHYSDATPAAAQPQQQPPLSAGAAAGPTAATATEQLAPAVIELVKRVSVTGLTVELLQLVDEGADGDAGSAAGGLCCSQLLYDAATADLAATAAALRESFMARSSHAMRSSSQVASAAAPPAAAASDTADSASGSAAAPAAAGEPLVAQLVPDLGGLLLGGPEAAGLDLKLELHLAWSTPAAAAAGGAGGGNTAQSGASGPAGRGNAGLLDQQATSTSNSSSQPPRITADLNSSAVSIYLQPWQLPLMQLCSAACSTGSSSSSSSNQAAAAAAASASFGSQRASAAASQQQQQPWGQRSFVEELFFPHVEGFVADSLNLSSPVRGANWGPSSSGLYNSVALGDGSGSAVLGGILTGSSSAAANAASGMYSMYHDARSVFSSVANSISGAMAGNILSGVYSGVSGTNHQSTVSSDEQQQQSTAAMYSSGLGGSTASSSSRGLEVMRGPLSMGSIWQQQQQPQQPLLPAAAWSVRALCPSVYVCLHYHTPTCVGAGGAPPVAAAACTSSSTDTQQQQQQPCLVLRCGGLLAAYEVSGRISHVSLKLYQLEAHEQLPSDWCVVAGADAGGCAGQLALQPRVFGSVPRVLPPTQGTAGFPQQVSMRSLYVSRHTPLISGLHAFTHVCLLLLNRISLSSVPSHICKTPCWCVCPSNMLMSQPPNPKP